MILVDRVPLAYPSLYVSVYILHVIKEGCLAEVEAAIDLVDTYGHWARRGMLERRKRELEGVS